MSGKPEVPFIELVRDTIRAHGLAWAVAYYYKRLPAWQARFFIKQAYLGA